MIQEYVRAKSKDEVVDLIRKGYTVLAGGTRISTHQEQITRVVDIQDIGLDGIRVEGESLLIGAFSKFAQICEHEKVWESLKKAIIQELKINLRNSSTIGGYVSVRSGYSNILAWLACANAKIHYYPAADHPAQFTVADSQTQRPKALIEYISIPLKADVDWEIISRAPDDFPLVGVFYNRQPEKQTITLNGYDEENCVTLHVKENERPDETLSIFQKNAHSQFNNKFIPFNYFKTTSLICLNRLIERGAL